MRAALLLAGTCLLLTALAPAASAGVGHVTLDVAGHHFTYTDPDPGYCKGTVGAGGSTGVVEVSTGSGGSGVDECRTEVDVL